MKSLIYKILFLLFIVKFAFAIPQPGEKYFVDIISDIKDYTTLIEELEFIAEDIRKKKKRRK